MKNASEVLCAVSADLEIKLASLQAKLDELVLEMDCPEMPATLLQSVDMRGLLGEMCGINCAQRIISAALVEQIEQMMAAIHFHEATITTAAGESTCQQ